MTEQEMHRACDEIAATGRAKGLVLVAVDASVNDHGERRAFLRHDGDGRGYAGDYVFSGRHETMADVLADLKARVEELPGAKERHVRKAVEALEAAREACLAIDADDVAASLTAAVARLSEDLIEHRRAAEG